LTPLQQWDLVSIELCVDNTTWNLFSHSNADYRNEANVLMDFKMRCNPYNSTKDINHFSVLVLGLMLPGSSKSAAVLRLQ